MYYLLLLACKINISSAINLISSQLQCISLNISIMYYIFHQYYYQQRKTRNSIRNTESTLHWTRILLSWWRWMQVLTATPSDIQLTDEPPPQVTRQAGPVEAPIAVQHHALTFGGQVAAKLTRLAGCPQELWHPLTSSPHPSLPCSASPDPHRPP